MINVLTFFSIEIILIGGTKVEQLFFLTDRSFRLGTHEIKKAATV